MISPEKGFPCGLRWCHGNPKRLVILGNGFDLAHGLDTSYESFARYLYEENRSLHFLLSQNMVIDGEACWWNFEENLGMGRQYEMTLDLASVIHDAITDYYDDDYAWMYDLLENVVVSLGNDVSDGLADYFSQWIKEVYQKGRHTVKELQGVDFSDAWVISFNYTYTAEDCYGVKNIFHIHGASGSRHLVFGHSGKLNYPIEARVDPQGLNGGFDSPLIENAIGSLMMSWEGLEKPTKDIISANQQFFNALRYVDCVETYGFSFSDADVPYIRALLSAFDASHVTWNIGYYSNPQELIRRACGCGIGTADIRLFHFDDGGKGALTSIAEVCASRQSQNEGIYNPKVPEQADDRCRCVALVDLAALIPHLKKEGALPRDGIKRAEEIYRYCLERMLTLSDAMGKKQSKYSVKLFMYDSRISELYHTNSQSIWNCPISLFRRIRRRLLDLKFEREMSREIATWESLPNVYVRDVDVDADSGVAGLLSINGLTEGDVVESNEPTDSLSVTYVERGADLRMGIDLVSLAYSSEYEAALIVSDRSNIHAAAQVAEEQGLLVYLDPLSSSIEDYPLARYVNGILLSGHGGLVNVCPVARESENEKSNYMPFDGWV